jgi:hypothetical protein
MKYHFFIFLTLLLPVRMQAQVQVLYNAKIFTANRNMPFAEAVAIRNGIFIAVGTTEEVKQKAGHRAVMTDMKGQVILPGFVDSHIHSIDGGYGLTMPNTFDKVLSVSELTKYASTVLASKKGLTGDILLIDGLNISTWSNLEDLNQAFNSGHFSRQPVLLYGSDGHTGWANRAMLFRAGVDRSFIQSLPEAEKIFFGHSTDYEPNGFFSESGYRKFRAVLPKIEDYSLAARQAVDYNKKLGITAWLDPSAGNTSDSSGSDFLRAYESLYRSGELNAHVSATIVAQPDEEPAKQIAAVRRLSQKFNHRNFRILGFKVFADGVLEHPTHTAALSLPYTGTSARGVLMFDPEKFNQFAIEADRSGFLLHVHAIGDLAVKKTLDAFEAARLANPAGLLPHIITHMQIVQPSDFSRFKKLDVLASLQLLWAYGDITTIDIVKPYIAPDLYKWQYPARSLLESGAIICGASDWPVSTANPFEAIYHAETRKGPMGVLDSTQCMPRMEMFYAYTIHAAKALMRDREIGSVEIGKSADLVCVDRDVFTVTAEQMKDAKVRWTMFEGKKVYTGE